MKMKNIKKFNEIFDDEELKAEFEIPYLKGEMGEDAMRWKEVSKPSDEETPESLHRKVLFRFPILNHFHEEVISLSGGSNIHSNYVSSTIPASDGNLYYAQLTTGFNDDTYFVNVILRDVRDYHNMSKWVNKNFQFQSIDGVYDMTKQFLNSCQTLGIITPRQKYPLEAN